MNKYLKTGLFGFMIWLIPFAVSVLIFPLRVSQRQLFESIMPVIIAVWTVFFSIFYLSRIKSDFLKMPLWDYATDIAVTYLMIPTITTGFGYLMEQRARLSQMD